MTIVWGYYIQVLPIIPKQVVPRDATTRAMPKVAQTVGKRLEHPTEGYNQSQQKAHISFEALTGDDIANQSLPSPYRQTLQQAAVLQLSHMMPLTQPIPDAVGNAYSLA